MTGKLFMFVPPTACSCAKPLTRLVTLISVLPSPVYLVSVHRSFQPLLESCLSYKCNTSNLSWIPPPAETQIDSADAAAEVRKCSRTLSIDFIYWNGFKSFLKQFMFSRTCVCVYTLLQSIFENIHFKKYLTASGSASRKYPNKHFSAFLAKFVNLHNATNQTKGICESFFKRLI